MVYTIVADLGQTCLDFSHLHQHPSWVLDKYFYLYYFGYKKIQWGGFRLFCLHNPNSDFYSTCTSWNSTQEKAHTLILFWIPYKTNQGSYHVHPSITPLEIQFLGEEARSKAPF